jgi:hypothetical protein
MPVTHLDPGPNGMASLQDVVSRNHGHRELYTHSEFISRVDCSSTLMVKAAETSKCEHAFTTLQCYIPADSNL